jgi:hypothetical protein
LICGTAGGNDVKAMGVCPATVEATASPALWTKTLKILEELSEMQMELENFSQSVSNASHMKVALRASLYAAALPAAFRWNAQLMTLPYSHSVSVVDLARLERIAEAKSGSRRSCSISFRRVFICWKVVHSLRPIQLP